MQPVNEHVLPSFSLADRSRRVLWQFSWTLLCRWTPPQFNFWRIAVLRLFGARVGHGVRVRSSVEIWDPKMLSLESLVTVGPYVRLYNMAPIKIRENARVSQYSTLCTGSHRIDSVALPLAVAPIIIGRNAWVCSNCFIGPGVCVGEGTVVGACAVAFRNLIEWSVYVGNPARIAKKREVILRSC